LHQLAKLVSLPTLTKKNIMGKVFTTKALRLKARAKRRTQSLRVTSPTLLRKATIEEKNRPVIAAIEAKIKASN
jgi:hypothetical protein